MIICQIAQKRFQFWLGWGFAHTLAFCFSFAFEIPTRSGFPNESLTLYCLSKSEYDPSVQMTA